MDSKQFAWLYLVTKGYAGVKHSYYGSYDPVDMEMFVKYKKSWSWYIDAKPEYLEKIKSIGVNWNTTKAPTSTSVSCFTDTFHEPEYEEKIIGTLTLNDGTKIDWIADSIEVTNVFDMMAMASQGSTDFYSIFG